MNEHEKQKAIEMVTNGMSIQRAAGLLNTTYYAIHHVISRAGIRGGIHQRNVKDLATRVWEYVEKEPNGCWFWIGTSTTLSRNYRTPGKLVKYALGLSTEGYKTGRICLNRRCLNPEHETATRKFSRDSEVIEKWSKHLAAKPHVTTLEKLGKEFGITRQRVEQIVKRAGLRGK